MDTAFWGSLASIVAIDLLLAGDNAVVIAIAVRPLPRGQRRVGIAIGALAAVILRVALTFTVAQLLLVPFVKLAGGLLVLWIALKLFAAQEDAGPGRSARSVWEAARLIVLADVSMSLDNMLAVGGASHGNPLLLLLGLGLSIPCVVLASDLLSRVLDRYPWLAYVGAALLGKVSAEMILEDPLLGSAGLHPGRAALWSAEVVLAAGVVTFGLLAARARRLATVAVADHGSRDR